MHHCAIHSNQHALNDVCAVIPNAPSRPSKAGNLRRNVRLQKPERLAQKRFQASAAVWEMATFLPSKEGAEPHRPINLQPPQPELFCVDSWMAQPSKDTALNKSLCILISSCALRDDEPVVGERHVGRAGSPSP